jgi:hypothetical protein
MSLVVVVHLGLTIVLFSRLVVVAVLSNRVNGAGASIPFARPLQALVEQRVREETTDIRAAEV